MKALALRVVTIAMSLGAIALLASPAYHAREVLGLFAIWVLSDLPESRASQALTRDERVAIGMVPVARVLAYVMFILLVSIGLFVTRSLHLTGASGYVVAIVVPVSVLYVGISLFTLRRLRRVQAPPAYRHAFLLTTVLQFVVLGAASWMVARQ